MNKNATEFQKNIKKRKKFKLSCILTRLSLVFYIREENKSFYEKSGERMENTKKILMAVISIAGTIYGLYEFYKKHEQEIKEIVSPLIKACEDIKDIKELA